MGKIKSELSLIIDRFQDPVPPHGWLIRAVNCSDGDVAIWEI